MQLRPVCGASLSKVRDLGWVVRPNLASSGQHHSWMLMGTEYYRSAAFR